MILPDRRQSAADLRHQRSMPIDFDVALSSGGETLQRVTIRPRSRERWHREDEDMPILLLNFAPEEIDPVVLDEIRTLAPSMRVVVTQDRSEIEALLDD